MIKKTVEPTQQPKERAILVGVDLGLERQLLPLEDSLAELELLARTAGLVVVGVEKQNLKRPNPKFYVGPGKAEEIKLIADELQADVIIFDEELHPRHLREWERLVGEGIKIVDRTALILDIFAQHARTREGSLQVELAQYEYRLPRLTRAWTHLARQAGGGGGRSGSVGGVGLRGPGETQLEVDRRDIRRRVSQLQKDLEKVRTHRQQHRSRRKKSRIPVITLVGYTNAGKSTLLNRLSDANVYVADQLFATLDPTTRRVKMPGGHLGLFSDTVGFIQKLPPQLIAAFRATLEEISEADLLLHVVDIHHQNAFLQFQSVIETLEEIGAEGIPMITVLNKIDLLADPSQASDIVRQFPNSVAISAMRNIGIDDLLNQIEIQLFETYKAFDAKIPYKEGGVISMLHEQGMVEEVNHYHGGVHLRGRVPLRFFSKVKPFLVQEGKVGEGS